MTDQGPATKRDIVEGNFDRLVSPERQELLSPADIGIFRTFTEVADAAKLLATSGPLLPKWLQANPGGLVGIIMQTIDWNVGRPPEKRISPIFAARMSFEVNGQVGFMAQMFTVLLNTSGLFKSRPRFDFDGEGPDRRCCVIMHFVGEVDPIVHWTPRFRDIKVKNSPNWQSDVDQQFRFYAIRGFGRVYCPEVFAGYYDAHDELEHIGADRAKDVTPKRFIGGATGPDGAQPGSVEAELQAAGHKPVNELDEIAADKPVAKPEPKPRARKPAEPAPNPTAETPASPSDVPPPVTEQHDHPGGSPPVGVSPAPSSHGAGPEQKDVAGGGSMPDIPENLRRVKEVVQNQPESGSATAMARSDGDKTPPPVADNWPPGVKRTAAECKNRDEFMPYAKAWMRLSGDPEAIFDRFAGEKGDRGRCGVLGEDFTELKDFRDTCIATLKEG
jgi:hypothetical protein